MKQFSTISEKLSLSLYVDPYLLPQAEVSWGNRWDATQTLQANSVESIKGRSKISDVLLCLCFKKFVMPQWNISPCSFGYVSNHFKQATNAEVRANATLLFTEAFPIHDPSMSSEMVDQAVQKQLDLLFVCQQLIIYCIIVYYWYFVIFKDLSRGFSVWK